LYYCHPYYLTNGFVRSYKNLHFYWILGAGHTVSPLLIHTTKFKSYPLKSKLKYLWHFTFVLCRFLWTSLALRCT